jgi:phenylacetate-CoA ligase
MYDLIYKNVVFPWLDRRRGYDLSQRLRSMSAALALPPGRLEVVRRERLRAMAVHAAGTCPFWRERFREAGLDPWAVRTVEELRRLPVLEKDDVRRNREAMLSDAETPERRREAMTGGSSAAPMVFYRDPACLADREASNWVYYGWMGRTPFDRWALVWGSQRDLGPASGRRADLRARLRQRCVILPGNRMESGSMERFVATLRRFRPRFLHGYAQAVYLLARHIQDAQLQAPRLDGVSVTAEPLAAGQRDVIEGVFGCRVFNLYGTREFGVLAAECPAHVGMHINPLNALVEFVDADGSPARPGRPGQVVVTDLLNRAMPLIRYRIGDLGVAREGGCPCGRDLPTMEVAAGRVTDFIVTPEGRYVAGASMTLVSSPGIARLQFVQRDRATLGVRYVRAAGFSPGDLARVEEKLKEMFGPGFRYCFEEVGEIPLTTSGKFVYVHSDVARARFEATPARPRAVDGLRTPKA